MGVAKSTTTGGGIVRYRAFLPSLGLAAILALACQEEPQEAGDMAQAPGTATGLEARSVEVDLEAINESGVSGTARIGNKDDQILIDLTLEGASPGERYVAYVHRGECQNDLGLISPVGELTVSEGHEKITGSIDKASLEPTQNYFAQVTTGDNVLIACGNLPGEVYGAAPGTESGTTEPLSSP
jgi:hypothetical protein